jgi:hypothetical protein
MSHQESRDTARSLAARALEHWVDQWDGYEGCIVTGYVLIGEVTRPGGNSYHLWLTGNGMPTDGESGPLPSWRVRGLVHELLSELDGREAYYQHKRFTE